MINYRVVERLGRLGRATLFVDYAFLEQLFFSFLLYKIRFKIAVYCEPSFATLPYVIVNRHKLDIRFTRDTEHPDPDVNLL